MMIAVIPGVTRVLGKSQGYLGLPVRDQIKHDSATDCDVPSMTTAWTPTPDELTALNAGASVYVTLLGIAHPPIYVGVGEPPAANDGGAA